MHSIDLLGSSDLRRGLWKAFITLSQSGAASLNRGTVLAAVSSGIVALCLLLAIVRSIAWDVLEFAVGSSAARRFTSRMATAAGRLIVVAVAVGAVLDYLIHHYGP